MKDTLTTNQAADRLAQFRDGSHFSYEGARALVEYLEELEDECEEEIEFDPIAFCCEYAEYPSIVDWAEDYFANWHEEFGITYTNPTTGEDEYQSVVDEDGNYHDEVLDAIEQYIQNKGMLIEFRSGVIVSSF